jgi:hypothetical protein
MDKTRLLLSRCNNRLALKYIITFFMLALLTLFPGSIPQARADLNTASTTPGNENWAGNFYAIGVDGPGYPSVQAILTRGMEVYIAGKFRIVGETVCYNIAYWDGRQWHELGGGTDGSSYFGPIYAMAVDNDGVLYIGGDFTSAGGSPANNIARWDGVSWSALGSGMNSVVYALAIDNNNHLYAGGSFTNAGGVGAKGIAYWDGSSWSTLTSGLTNGGTTYALAYNSNNGNLFVGGNFDWAGGVNSPKVALWNGSSWSGMGTTFSGYSNKINALIYRAANNTLYAGGSFFGGETMYNLAQWNGSSWSAVGSNGGVNDYVYSLTFDPGGNLYVGGSFTSVAGGAVSASGVARWDGTSWSALGSGVSNGGNPYSVYALGADSFGNLYAGGDFEQAGGSLVGFIARWNGSAWSRMTKADGQGLFGYTGFVRSFVLNPNGNLLVGGDYFRTGTQPMNNLATWDGNAWHAWPAAVNATIHDIAPISGSQFYASNDDTLFVGSPFIARWDGSQWQPLGTGLDLYAFSLAYDSSSGYLYAGGYFSKAGSVSTNYVARWNGSTWSALGSGIASGSGYHLEALLLDSSHNLYAGGKFTSAGGASAANIAMWNGSTWLALGAGLNDTVYDLEIDPSGSLWAAGSFTSSGGAPANYIAKWNGSSWTGLPSSVNSTVTALAFDASGYMYAAGEFTMAGGMTAMGIARWDGNTNTWSPMGSGLDYRPLDLIYHPDGSLYVGGQFTAAGGKASQRIARWTTPMTQSGVLAGQDYTFYPENIPMTITVETKGTLDKLIVQRFDASHPNATGALDNGYYWQITGLVGNGDPAVDFILEITLTCGFTPGVGDKICRYNGSDWDCDASSFSDSTITISGVTQLSDWAIGRNAGPHGEVMVFIPLTIR